ncbi:uncharacterized protein LOC131598375 [Vicia villosa]|uniref:uncharacterized protein LOC131598375 n=1 Tax=Vicia villosa TaxID=3911 RepID=UPI00273C21C5|nr:uncharacterized protein LOC131598375 [Vicia villosa]
MGGWQEDSWRWDLDISGDMLLEDPTDLMEVMELLEILASAKPVERENDSFIWWPAEEGAFTVKSCYLSLRDRLEEDTVEANKTTALNLIWKSQIPSKLKVFGWRVLLDRLPSKIQLARRGIILNEQDKMCVFCGTELEDLDHVLFSCSFSKNVWNNIGSWLQIQMVEGGAGIYHLEQCIIALKGKVKKKKICLLWLATIWIIWNARNKLCFENEPCVLEDLVANIKVVSWIWQAIGSRNRRCSSFYNWVHAPLDFINL